AGMPGGAGTGMPGHTARAGAGTSKPARSRGYSLGPARSLRIRSSYRRTYERTAPPAARQVGGLRGDRPAAAGSSADSAVAGNGARRRGRLLGVASRSRVAILDRDRGSLPQMDGDIDARAGGNRARPGRA